jgi:predicted dehydrogenase
MNIVVIGTGMYVSGRRTDGYGTILPAVLEYKRAGGDVNEVHLIGTNRVHTFEAQAKAEDLMLRTGISVNLKTYPDDVEKDPDAYKKVLEKITSSACAIVAVPDHLHFEITRSCLEAGFHTLVVKPLTPTVKEAVKLIKLAESKNLYGAVEFHKRWDRQNLLLRDSFKSGQLGELLYTWTEYSQRKSIPTQIFKSWVEKTNIFQYLGVHYVDIIRFITCAVPKRVMAIGQKNWLIKQGINNYDSIQCIIEWQLSNGKTFSQTLLVNWVDPDSTTAMSDQKLKFVGTNGRFEGDQKNRGISFIYDNKHVIVPNPDFCQPYGVETGLVHYQGYGIDSVVTFLNDVNAITNGKNTPSDFEGLRPTFAEGLYSTAVVGAAGKSLAADGEWQQVEGL